MDYKEAVSEALVAMRNSSNPEGWDEEMVEVPYSVLHALTDPNNTQCRRNHWDEDEHFLIARNSGPALWYVGTDGCAYSIDQGGSEIPEGEREREIAVSLTGLARKMIWRAE